MSKNESESSNALANGRAKRDLITIMQSKKMYVNEKKYLSEVVKNLKEMGFYSNNTTIFNYIEHK